MKTKTFFSQQQEYVTPVANIFTIFSEGCLCASGDDDLEGGDAGIFGENVW